MTYVAGSREPMLDLAEASARTGLPVKTLRTAISNGHLPGRQPRGQRKLYVLVEDLDDWATAPARPAPRPVTRSPKVTELRPRDAAPGSVDRLNAIEERSVAQR